MRKFLFFILVHCLFFITAAAQLSVTGGKTYPGYTGIDYLIVLNDIGTNEITYTGSYTSINWYKFTDNNTTTFIQSGLATLLNTDINDATGYILDVDGVKTTFWVIEYKNYLPVFNSLSPSTNLSDQCETIKLNLDATIPSLYYKIPSGTTFQLHRKFKVAYQTLKWETDTWNTLDTIVEITDPSTFIEVPAPLVDTKFTLSSDDYVFDLGLSPVSIESEMYSAVAVVCKPTTEVVLREELNEAERPSEATQIKGSAPLDILFKANANEAVTKYYNWEIRKDSILLATRSEKEQRYSFTEAGVYTVKVLVSNQYCLDTASVMITVSESQIYVPNVFTPNGDGKNDEFRVAYKSIVQFQCWIYNRWGRQVYSWTNPQKGWDGTYNGKKMPAGPYFYVIQAVGSDKVEHKLKGSVSLLRGVNR